MSPNLTSLYELIINSLALKLPIKYVSVKYYMIWEDFHHAWESHSDNGTATKKVNLIILIQAKINWKTWFQKRGIKLHPSA